MVQKDILGTSAFVNIKTKNLNLLPKMSRAPLDMNDNEPDVTETATMPPDIDEIDLLKARIKENSLLYEKINSSDTSIKHQGSGWHLPDVSSSEVSDKSESLCQSTETLIDHFDASQNHYSDGCESEHVVNIPVDRGRIRNLSGSETGKKSNSHNEIALATSIQSGLLISPSSLTQDIPVEMGSDNKRMSTVLESLDLHLVYIPSTHQLVATKAQVPGIATENVCLDKPEFTCTSKNDNGTFKQDTGYDDKSDSNLSTPTKMATTDSSSLHSVSILSPTTLDDSSSICETDCLIKIQEPDQLTCDSSEFECNFPRNSTNDSLLRTFTDASSLSSLSTGTDFSVSAASLDDGETGMCIDTGDGGFMEINLHSRNSYERAKNPSQDSGFEDRSVKPKRKGLSAFISRYHFSLFFLFFYYMYM